MRGRLNFALVAALGVTLGAGSAAAATCGLGKLAELPVTMVDFRPLISARINGAEARLFIDTGSFWVTIAPSSVSKFDLHVSQNLYAVRVQGVTGAAEDGQTRAAEFDLDRFKFHGVDLLVADHDIGSSDGLVGQNLMGAADAEYDLANGVVRLFAPDKNCVHTDLAYWSPTGGEMLPIAPIRPPDNQIRGEAMLNGVKITVVFDTGTPRSVVSLSAARRAGVRMDGPDVERLGVAGGVGRRTVEQWLAPFKTFAIGDEQVRGTRLRVADIDIGADMLVGADFFLSHRLFIAKSQSRIYFTYNGGPVFDLERGVAAPPPAAAAAGAVQPPPPATPQVVEADDTPKDAPGFQRRADAFLNRQQFDKAINDYTSAIALQPDDAELYSDRGAAYVADTNPKAALADFDQSLKLRPEAPLALLARGELRLASGDAAGARADFDAALRLTPGAAPAVARLYASGGFYADAVAAYDRMIDGKPMTEDLAHPLFLRCRARTYGGLELDKAIADCNQAMRLMPGALEYWQVRGVAYLRQGKLDAAIADFNDALKLEPRDAWSLYARSLAEAKQGLAAKSAADLAAATALNPNVAETAKGLGWGP